MTWTLRTPGLDDLSLEPGDGYAVVAYDLGFPQVRKVVDLNADGDGETDLTTYHGARLLTLDIRVLGNAPAERQMRAMMLRRFMAPPVRAEVLWDAAYGPVRLLGRPDAFSAQVGEAMTRQVARCAWSIPSGLIESQQLRTVTLYPGAGQSPGRSYDLVFNRAYPAGVVAGSQIVMNLGTARTQPLLRIFGPCVNPVAQIFNTGGRWDFTAAGGLTIAAGDWVDVDVFQRSAVQNSNPALSVFAKLDLATLAWAPLAPGMNDVRFNVGGGSNTSTQMQIIYRDAWY